VSQLDPSAPSARHTPVALQIKPTPQSLFVVQACSAKARVLQVPHAALGARAQRVLAHCASLPQLRPF
jgi:hypothetical protein